MIHALFCISKPPTKFDAIAVIAELLVEFSGCILLVAWAWGA